jgi:hypothetical protein
MAKIKFLKATAGHAKGDVVDLGNDVLSKWYVNKGLAKETDENLTHRTVVKEKNENAGPNAKK